jgi:hypothetical protein
VFETFLNKKIGTLGEHVSAKKAAIFVLLPVRRRTALITRPERLTHAQIQNGYGKMAACA